MTATREQWLDYLRTPLGNDADAETGSDGEEPTGARGPAKQDPDG